MLTHDDIYSRFKSPVDNQTTKNISKAVGDVAHFLTEILPESREKSLAITRLEEAVMWANAAIARNTGG